MAESIITVKLDPEQLEMIKKTYLETLDRVIQERQVIKGKMELTLKHITEICDRHMKLHPEGFIGDDSSFHPNMKTEAGIILDHVLDAIQLVKQVYDSIETEVSDEPT